MSFRKETTPSAKPKLSREWKKVKNRQRGGSDKQYQNALHAAKKEGRLYTDTLQRSHFDIGLSLSMFVDCHVRDLVIVSIRQRRGGWRNCPLGFVAIFSEAV